LIGYDYCELETALLGLTGERDAATANPCETKSPLPLHYGLRAYTSRTQSRDLHSLRCSSLRRHPTPMPPHYVVATTTLKNAMCAAARALPRAMGVLLYACSWATMPRWDLRLRQRSNARSRISAQCENRASHIGRPQGTEREHRFQFRQTRQLTSDCCRMISGSCRTLS